MWLIFILLSSKEMDVGFISWPDLHSVNCTFSPFYEPQYWFSWNVSWLLGNSERVLYIFLIKYDCQAVRISWPFEHLASFGDGWDFQNLYPCLKNANEMYSHSVMIGSGHMCLTFSEICNLQKFNKTPEVIMLWKHVCQWQWPLSSTTSLL